MPGKFDHATMGDAFTRPGADPRQWISYGIVAPDTDGASSVHFKNADDAPMPEGPIIAVILQPSNITVPCRVAGGVAGNGEGDWFPFQANDEVLVAVPEGDERAGCVVIARLNNELDTFPAVVAGQDASKNTFGFRRLRTPYIVETAASYLIRSAVTGAQFGIDQTGQFILNDGDGSRFFVGADAVGFSTADGSTSMQMLVGDKQIILTAGATTSLQLDAAASKFLSTGTLNVGTSGLGGTGHAVTLEQVVNLFVNFLFLIKTAGDPSTWAGTILNPGAFPGALVAALTTWLQAAAGPIPITAAVGGGNLTPLLGLQQIILAALATQLPDPQGLAPVPIFMPGMGRAGFMY